MRRQPMEAAPRNLTPGFEEHVVRGIDVTADARLVILTTANQLGFSVWQLDLNLGLEPRLLFRSDAEAWLAIASADGSLVAVETTDHCPGIRRFAVTVIAVATGDIVATLSDGPAGPVRRVAFSAVPGDPRLLVSTERAAGGDVLLEMFDGGHMPGGLAALRHDQGRMLELVGRALRGERWSVVSGRD